MSVMITESQRSQAAELILHLAQHRPGKRLQFADEPAIVDGSALIDHQLAILAVAGSFSNLQLRLSRRADPFPKQSGNFSTRSNSNPLPRDGYTEHRASRLHSTTWKGELLHFAACPEFYPNFVYFLPAFLCVPG